MRKENLLSYPRGRESSKFHSGGCRGRCGRKPRLPGIIALVRMYWLYIIQPGISRPSGSKHAVLLDKLPSFQEKEFACGVRGSEPGLAWCIYAVHEMRSICRFV